MLGRIPTETKRTNPKRLDTEVVVAITHFRFCALPRFQYVDNTLSMVPLVRAILNVGCCYISLTKEIKKKYIVGNRKVKYLI